MIAMSNFEEFARAVGKDVKDIKEQQLTKSEFNSKDCITGNSEYDFLKRSVQELEKQNKLLQEQLALVKPTPRRAPTGYSIDKSELPWTIWFDNGCGMQVTGNPGNDVIYGTSEHVSVIVSSSNWKIYPLLSNILSYCHGTLSLEKIKLNIDATYWDDGIKVLNPIKNEDEYDWSNVFFSTNGTRAEWIRSREKNVARVFYALGILNAKTVESLGAVRR